MADNNPESIAKRGRGRPRGSGTRGRRGRTGDPRGVVGTSGTDKPKAVAGEDICGGVTHLVMFRLFSFYAPQGLCHHHQERLPTDHLHRVRRRRLW
jgi:hypothetical protein